MTEQEIINILKKNKETGIAFGFMPKEVRDWVSDNFNDTRLLALQRDGEWDLNFDHDYDSYDNAVFALPDMFELSEDKEESEHKYIADSMLLAARVIHSNCIKINCQECVLYKNGECLLNSHPSYWNLSGDDNED